MSTYSSFRVVSSSANGSTQLPSGTLRFIRRIGERGGRLDGIANARPRAPRPLTLSAVVRMDTAVEPKRTGAPLRAIAQRSAIERVQDRAARKRQLDPDRVTADHLVRM